MRVTNFDLKVGDVVFIKKRDPWNPYPYGPSRRWPFDLNRGMDRGMKGGLFLSVERGNRWCGHVKNYRGELITFQSKRDVERFCQEHGFVLEKEEGRWSEKYKLHLVPDPDLEKYNPTYDLEVLAPSAKAPETSGEPICEEEVRNPKEGVLIRQVFIEVIRGRASKDLRRLEFLVAERERYCAELRRRKELGSRSCLCFRCRRELENGIKRAEKRIDTIQSWWLVSLGTTPADAAADGWQP